MKVNLASSLLRTTTTDTGGRYLRGKALPWFSSYGDDIEGIETELRRYWPVLLLSNCRTGAFLLVVSC